ncbi:MULTISPECIES: hypothetical protein [unclassified Collinsella]|uniref:hypothetical protein n=1 Tax=unclassified Collinsella TaxID=2637548 RepID=UPI00319E58BF
MGKNLAAFKDRCKRITWAMLLCGIAFILFGMMASADASSAYDRYSSSYSVYSGYSSSSALREYSSKMALSSTCTYAAAVCAAVGDIAVLGWVGSNMLAAFGKDLAGVDLEDEAATPAEAKVAGGAGDVPKDGAPQDAAAADGVAMDDAAPAAEAPASVADTAQPVNDANLPKAN